MTTRDVYQYLKNPDVRDTIEAGVRQAMTPGVPTIVESHSLGTVVAYSLLPREGTAAAREAPLFVTLEIANKTDVDNHVNNRHGIAGNLDNAVVAQRICAALS